MPGTYNLAEAGNAVGLTKAAILKAIRRGAISASRNEVNGNWCIEPAELHRVYPPVTAKLTPVTPVNGDGELRARLADALDQVADLRRRLDAADDERRRLTERLLADQRRRPWWRLFT